MVGLLFYDSCLKQQSTICPLDITVDASPTRWSRRDGVDVKGSIAEKKATREWSAEYGVGQNEMICNI